MNKSEVIIFRILRGLRDICTCNGISMWLMEQTALSAFREERLVGSTATVCVPAEEILRLERILQNDKVRSFGVESMLNNSDYPRYELRVFDQCTTDCDTADFYRINNNCLHVTVYPLYNQKEFEKRKKSLPVRVRSFISGPSARFKMLAKVGKRDSKIIKAGGFTFESGIFSESRELKLYDETFMIPADYDRFFTIQFGYGWRYLIQEESTPDSNHFFDAEKSWNEYKASVSEDETADYVRTLRKYKAESAEYSKANKERNRVYAISDQSCDKIRLYREYAGRTAEMKELLICGKYKELENVLNPYLECLKKYYDLGLDMYINDEFTEIVECFLRETGSESFADETHKLIPEVREPVYLTDYRGKPLKKLPEYTVDPEKDGVDGLSETQKRLLELMKRVDCFLREKGIEYFLFGGSLLGAIRHNGFIPWDDDIDIVMSRDNYYRLIDLSDDLPWDDIAFVCYEKDPKFRRPFGMFNPLTDTRFVKSRIFNGGAGLGTGIDVFVMDNVPSDCLEDYLKNSLLYQEVMTDVFINNARLIEFKDDYFECMARAEINGRDAEIRRLTAELEKYGSKKDDHLQVVRLWARKPRIYEPGMMENPILHRFEDTEFPVPERAVECLARQYGEDWNVIPEDAGRKMHGFRIDYEISANNYYRLIDKSVDWDEADRMLNKRKQCRIKLFDKIQKLEEFKKKLYEGK